MFSIFQLNTRKSNEERKKDILVSILSDKTCELNFEDIAKMIFRRVSTLNVGRILALAQTNITVTEQT